MNNTVDAMRFLFELERAAERRKIKLTTCQRDAANFFIDSNFGVRLITGGPGTGKTELIKCVTLAAIKLGMRMPAMMATTARAANNLVTEFQHLSMTPTTVHRFLQYDGTDFKRVAPESFIFVEESSMLDINLLARLLQVTASKIILMGDHNQLPPIGPGYPFRDMVECGKFDTVVLDEVFRQDAGGSIAKAANAMSKGQKIFEYEDEFLQFVDIRDDDKSVEYIRGRVNPHSWQVITPMHRGTLGTQNLNKELQLQFLSNITPLKGIRIANNTPVRIGDRVIQKKNNYRLNIFNGDKGVITGWNEARGSLMVSFNSNTPLEILGQQALSDLHLSYAITTHSMQGCEAENVLIPMSKSHHFMWNRALLYTALTRAKKRCILVGNMSLISSAIRNTRAANRKTWMREELCHE